MARNKIPFSGTHHSSDMMSPPALCVTEEVWQRDARHLGDRVNWFSLFLSFCPPPFFSLTHKSLTQSWTSGQRDKHTVCCACTTGPGEKQPLYGAAGQQQLPEFYGQNIGQPRAVTYNLQTSKGGQSLTGGSPRLDLESTWVKWEMRK